MFSKFLKLFEKNRDTLAFQISEDFIEVVALRQDEEVVTDGECLTEMLYSKRIPIAKPSGKKVLDDLAKQVGTLADTAVSSQELHMQGFNVKGSKVVCVLVTPLSVQANVTYKAEFKKPVNINNKLLARVLSVGETDNSQMVKVPKGYAVYLEELTNIELNGYSLHRPLDKQASKVTVTVTNNMMDPKVWSAVGSVLESTFHREVQYIHTQRVIELSEPSFCTKIYTVSQLQAITNAII